jgi:prophage regulatory protein
MPAKYLRRPAVSERYNLPRSTLYDLIAKGHFPKPVRLGVRAVGWPIDELEAWEHARGAERKGGSR